MNIQINIKNEQGGYDTLYANTKAELVEGLVELLNTKLDKVEGKGLSTNDYTDEEKQKLANIEVGAQVNTVLSVAGRMGDVILSKTDVGLGNVENKSAEQILAEMTADHISTALEYIPENALNKDAANGYAGLDANGKIKLSQLPDTSRNQTFIVADPEARLALAGMIRADKCYETETGDSYIYDGEEWLIMADADWQNVNLDWVNIINGPESSVENIDDAVAKRHAHTNRTVLDKLSESTVKESYDLSKFITDDDLAEAGFAEEDHTHNVDDIVETEEKQFVTAAQKLNWNSKTNIVLSKEQPTNQVAGDIWFSIIE